MGYGWKGKNDTPKPPDIETEVYSCESEECNGWMRKEFVTSEMNCPLCGCGLVTEIKTVSQMVDPYPFK